MRSHAIFAMRQQVTKWVAVAAAALAGVTAADDYCDGHYGDFCQLNNRIPCHDTTCQVAAASYPCAAGTNASACAATAAAACAQLPGCVAFGLCVSDACPSGHDSPWVEYYNSKATAAPLDSNDWVFYYNESRLGPPPAPAPTCVPGPSRCLDAPAWRVHWEEK